MVDALRAFWAKKRRRKVGSAPTRSGRRRIVPPLQIVHPDGSEEVEVMPYDKVFLGDVGAAAARR